MAQFNLPLSRPILPTLDKLAPYLAQIDRSRFYTNGGALLRTLNSRLSRHFGIRNHELAITNSGTSAITAAILASVGYAREGKDLCVCPSYSFAATAVAARACGYTPYFADVDYGTWSLNPQNLSRAINLNSVALVIVVAPYGRPVDLNAWSEFKHASGIPVIVDGAATFDTVNAPDAVRTEIPFCVSLHATKSFSTAEGGLVIATEDVVERVNSTINFGFNDRRESIRPGINGKMSEYHAAIGLAELDGWKEKRASFIRTGQHYRRAAEQSGLADKICVSTDSAIPYSLYCASREAEVEAAIQSLSSHNIEHRFWYGRGIHLQQEFSHCPVADCLPVTERLCKYIVGLPHSADLTYDDAMSVVRALA